MGMMMPPDMMGPMGMRPFGMGPMGGPMGMPMMMPGDMPMDMPFEMPFGECLPLRLQPSGTCLLGSNACSHVNGCIFISGLLVHLAVAE